MTQNRLWGLIDSKITDHYEFIYKPALIVQNPTFIPSRRISLIVCMLDPPSSYINRLHKWLANYPLEIIIVTTADHYDQVCCVVHDVALPENSLKTIQIVTSSKEGK